MGDVWETPPEWPLVTFLRARLDERRENTESWITAAEIDAKRRIIDEYEDHGWLEVGPEAGDLADVLRILAAVYSDHPDYDQEWKP